MRRVMKEAISGIVLIASLIAMILLEQLDSASPNDSYGIAILLLVIISFLSIAALVAFSRTGWKVEGSESDWGTAILLGPSALLFKNRNDKEQLRKEKKMDQEKDEKYYGQRSK